VSRAYKRIERGPNTKREKDPRKPNISGSSIVDSFQTTANNATNDSKLKHLVKIFSFLGNY